MFVHGPFHIFLAILHESNPRLASGKFDIVLKIAAFCRVPLKPYTTPLNIIWRNLHEFDENLLDYIFLSDNQGTSRIDW